MNNTHTPAAPPPEALRLRRLRLTRGDTQGRDDLAAIDGLIEARTCADGTRLRVSYDARIIALDTLVQRLREQGVAVADDRRSRLRIAWQSYLDRNARANLAHPGSPCCSNPAAVYAARSKHREKT